MRAGYLAQVKAIQLVTFGTPGRVESEAGDVEGT
jgi:hypothetical protein